MATWPRRWSRTAARATRTPSTRSAAYVAALDAGAEGLECDVRLTADGHLVCVHDRDLRRTGEPPRRWSRRWSLADLAELDFASWKNPWADLDDEAPDRDEPLDGVLTLRKLLETVADYDRRVEVAIETKHPTRYGGLVEKRVVELLHDFGWDAPGGDPPGAGDELQLHRAAADGAAGARRPARAADRQGAVLADAAPGDRQRLDRRPRHRAAPRAPQARPQDRRVAATTSTCGRSTPRRTSSSARSSG